MKTIDSFSSACFYQNSKAASQCSRAECFENMLLFNTAAANRDHPALEQRNTNLVIRTQSLGNFGNARICHIYTYFYSYCKKNCRFRLVRICAYSGDKILHIAVTQLNLSVLLIEKNKTQVNHFHFCDKTEWIVNWLLALNFSKLINPPLSANRK